MAPSELAALHARITASLAGRERQRGAGGASPVARYLDLQRFEHERKAMKALPLAVCAASRLADAGDWLATEVHGVPVLLTRARDGKLRAFLNVCRHRGVVLAAAGSCGRSAENSGRERFTCPYHNWTYAADGQCIGRPHDADFAHAPRDGLGLVELPVAERLGLIWVVATRQAGFDWDGYFGAMGMEVETLGFRTMTTAPLGRTFKRACNWKLVFDANLETYHFLYAHKDTIAPLFHDNILIHDQYGDHQRLVLPKRSFNPGAPMPASLEGFAKTINIIYFFFPSTLLLWEGDHINGFSVTPESIAQSRVDAWLLVPDQHRTARDQAYWQRNFDMFWGAIDEDFDMAESMQRGLASGANDALCLSAAEFPCAHFHDAIERRIG